MMRCSMSESFTGLLCVWTMKTSHPRMERSYLQWISPLANSRRLTSPTSTPKWRAMSSASCGCERPETSSSRRRGISSMVTTLLVLVPLRLRRSAGGLDHRMGGHLGAVGHLGAGLEHAERAHRRPGADHGSLAGALPHPGARAHRRVDEEGAGPDFGALADDAGPAQDHAGEERDIGCEQDTGVDIGPLGIPHGDAPPHPALV